MAPRLHLLSRSSSPYIQSYQPLAPFLYPQLPQQSQVRAASILSHLSDTKGAYNKRIRVGRGPSSGYGKTSGRGHKGQKQHGKVPVGMNGGQTPDWKVHGKRGFENHFSTDMSPVNLNKIQHWINNGRLDPSQPITLKELARSRCVHGVGKDGVKLLARGKQELSTAINIVVSRASAAAIEAVENAGGKVVTRYYTDFAIKKIRKGEMDPIHSLQSRIALAGEAGEVSEEAKEAVAGQALQMERQGKYKYRLPDPTSRKDLEYYRDEARRGYLSYLVAKGQGPSLFFKTPGMDRRRKGRKSAGRGGSGLGENRVF
jgi:large subunit ribosomal protein L15